MRFQRGVASAGNECDTAASIYGCTIHLTATSFSYLEKGHTHTGENTHSTGLGHTSGKLRFDCARLGRADVPQVAEAKEANDAPGELVRFER